MIKLVHKDIGSIELETITTTINTKVEQIISKIEIAFRYKPESFSEIYLKSDAPEAGQLYLSDPASTYMEGLLSFNQELTFVITAIILLVGWLLFSTVYNSEEFYNSTNKSFYHSNVLEIVWTSLPALTLLALAPSSFALLYSLDEILAPKISAKVIGHQWYWSYEVSDFDFLMSCSDAGKTIKYTCYMLSTEAIFEKNYIGFFRLLETNKRLLVPANTQIRLLVTSVDVLHSWTIPSFGIKVDACPGRLNQVSIFLKRAGLFFGQCSEICGVNHGFMPVALCVTPSTQYELLVSSKLS